MKPHHYPHHTYLPQIAPGGVSTCGGMTGNEGKRGVPSMKPVTYGRPHRLINLASTWVARESYSGSETCRAKVPSRDTAIHAALRTVSTCGISAVDSRPLRSPAAIGRGGHRANTFQDTRIERVTSSRESEKRGACGGRSPGSTDQPGRKPLPGAAHFEEEAPSRDDRWGRTDG